MAPFALPSVLILLGFGLTTATDINEVELSGELECEIIWQNSEEGCSHLKNGIKGQGEILRNAVRKISNSIKGFKNAYQHMCINDSYREAEGCEEKKIRIEEECLQLNLGIEEQESILIKTVRTIAMSIIAFNKTLTTVCDSKSENLMLAPADVQQTCKSRPPPCFKGVSCSDLAEGGVKCGSCPWGHTGNGRTCVKQKTCSDNPCYDGADCFDKQTAPFYKCGPCPAGTNGDGIKCDDIDECKLANPCDPRVKCHNYSPGFKCDGCPEGFTGSKGVKGVGIIEANKIKQTCVDIDECADGANGGCTDNSYCINTEGSFLCGECKDGFFGNQTIGCKKIPGYCTDERECDANALCAKQHDLNTRICKCKIGWAGNGYICGTDSDHDGWPDRNLGCSEQHCYKDNCKMMPNVRQEDTDSDGIGDVCDSDADDDGILNESDNCILMSNRDQKDWDKDGKGDVCDNCPDKPNIMQEDEDKDGIGNACDPDIDNDGTPNESDNCPNKYNPDQLDDDSDGVGNTCDNCLTQSNPFQADIDMDLVGDACDNDIDVDKDGIQDNIDNCPDKENSDQLDTDGDHLGDSCDEDRDGDDIPDYKDNCLLIHNPGQDDVDRNGIGDVCQDDLDGDKVLDFFDNCPNNSNIFKTDFRKYQNVIMNPSHPPEWVVSKDGTEVLQTKNSDPGILVGNDAFSGVDFEGTLFVSHNDDDDYIGVVFSYQGLHKYYAVMWKKNSQKFWNKKNMTSIAKSGIQLKLIDSVTGYNNLLRSALWHSGTVKEQVKLLWKDSHGKGWTHNVPYKWKLLHRPNIGLIRVKIYEGPNLIADSGNVFDHTLRGGRLGVYCFSQEMVTWSNLVYRCNDHVPEDMYNELPRYLQDLVAVEKTSIS